MDAAEQFQISSTSSNSDAVIDSVSVDNNTVTLNGGYGLILLANDAYLSNVITDNGSGTVQGGVNVGGNACNGVAACP